MKAVCLPYVVTSDKRLLTANGVIAYYTKYLVFTKSVISLKIRIISAF